MTQSRTHYIPVSGITIDTINDAITDAVTDAITDTLVGGDTPGVTIDPKLFCEYHGFEKPDTGDDVVPVTVNPESGNIQLLCNNQSPYIVGIRVTTSTGQYNTKVHDMSGNLISEQNTNSNVIFACPLPLSAGQSIITISPVTVGAELRTFTLNNSVTGYSTNWPVVGAKFNTPGITGLSGSFRNMRYIKNVQIISTVNALTTMAEMFYSSSIQVFTFPPELPVLTTMNSMFRDSGIITINIKNSNLPKLETATYFCAVTASLREIEMPETLPLVTDLSFFLNSSGCKKLILSKYMPELQNMNSLALSSLIVNLTLPVSCPKVVNLNSFVSGAYLLKGELLFPPMNGVTTASTPFTNCRLLTKISFEGSTFLGATYSSFFTGCTDLQEVIFPSVIDVGTSQLNLSQVFVGNGNLRKIKLPDSIVAVRIITTNWLLNASMLSEVLGNCSYTLPAGETFQFAFGGNIFIASINHPNLQVSTFSCGGTNANIEYANIDYANSKWAATIALTLQGKLSTSEIERIYSALPTVSGGTYTIQMQNNPGFSGANHAIAQAKGWTVTGA